MKYYIFVYNVIYIKSDFIKLKDQLPNTKFILIASQYCLKYLNSQNKQCFDDIHQISRDFHQVEFDEINTIISKYIDSKGANNIQIFTNEDSTQLVCAKIRALYNIAGHNVDTLLPFVNKVVSKNKLGSTVRLPKFSQFNKQLYIQNGHDYLNNLISNLGNFPIFAKPIDLVSSIETRRINTMQEFKQLADYILIHNYEFEIDEFIDGELFHCDAMIINGEIAFFMVGKCSFPLARFFEGYPVGSIPINDPDLFNEIKTFNIKVFNALNCPDGAYHLELFQQYQTNELIFLEVGARTGGALITNVYQKLFGINIEEINYLIQMKLIDKIPIQNNNIYAGFLNFPTKDGTIIGIQAPDTELQNEFITFCKSGDKIKTAKNLLDISCSIIFWDKDYNKIRQKFEYLKNYQPLVLK